MSWEASAWAKKQRLGSPSAKSILLCLADYADAEQAACWPSQAVLASDAEVSERTVREWLQRLEDWGLIERERRARPSGARASDRILLLLDRRVLDGEERCRRLKDGGAESDSLPANSAGRSNRQPDAEPTGNEAQPTGNHFRASKEEPSREPPMEPLTEGAQARERGDDREERKKAEAAYWRMVRVWPDLKGMPKNGGLNAFIALTPDDRATAERRFPAWQTLLRAQGKSHTPGPLKYFGQRLFDEVADPQPEARPEVVVAPPFGPQWMVLRLQHLLAGPTATGMLRLTGFEASQVEAGKMDRATLMRAKTASHGFPAVNAMHDRASQRRGEAFPTRLDALAALMEAVPVDGATMAAWREEHERRGWPWLPDWGAMRVVYFPRGGPAGLEAFEAAVNGNGEQEAAHDGGGREAAE